MPPWHARTSSLPGKFRRSHGGGRLSVACLWGRDPGGHSRWMGVAPHCAHPARCRCGGRGRQSSGPHRVAKGNALMPESWRSVVCVAFIGGGVQAAARRPWSCGSAHPARSAERYLSLLLWGGSSAAFCPSRPHITLDLWRALLGPDAHHMVRGYISGAQLAFIRTCWSRGAEGTVTFRPSWEGLPESRDLCT